LDAIGFVAGGFATGLVSTTSRFSGAGFIAISTTNKHEMNANAANQKFPWSSMADATGDKSYGILRILISKKRFYI
jgi:hypothetical protein